VGRTTVITPEAWEEIDEAFDWYEQQEAGLGHRFFKALKRSVDLANAHPESYPPRFDEIRRIMLKKFPDSVYFNCDDLAIYIHSIFHESRNSSRLDRLKKS
jgi:toxin ParE1/3/4